MLMFNSVKLFETFYMFLLIFKIDITLNKIYFTITRANVKSMNVVSSSS